MRRHAKWVVLWSLWLSGLVPPATRPVRVRGGAVRGRLAPDGSHAAYLGVPYARVTRRFQAPGAAPAWDGVLDAVDEHVRCAQRFGPLVLGAEDCLRLNVYAPPDAAAAAAALPVMVLIHGGGFFEGSGSRLLYGPDYLVAKGVVLVTFNYRLAAPGFLCLGTADAPGNAGLKDQVAALRWVRENVAAFGGDPDNVTIFGESAGGASVSLHLVSPMSRGLFHRAIVQSGSALAPWALQPGPALGRAAAADLARSLGRDVRADDPRELYNILMNATIEELLSDPIPRKEGRVLLEHMPYVPCVESRTDGAEAFITESPHDVLSTGGFGRVPVIVGFNDAEGFFFTAMEEDETMFASDFEGKLPGGLSFPTARERREAALTLRRLYMGAGGGGGGGAGGAGDAEAVRRLARFYGDAYFAAPALAETELLARAGGRVFAYVLAHVGWRNLPKLRCGARYWRSGGATHADDLFYLFRVFPLPAWPDRAFVDTLTTLWTNFAKHGEPGAAGAVTSWPAVSPREGEARALRLGAAPRTAPLWSTAALRYWRTLYQRYRAR